MHFQWPVTVKVGSSKAKGWRCLMPVWRGEDRLALIREITERLNRMRSPFRSAERFQIEEIIDPCDTRPLLCEFADLAAPLRQPGLSAFTYRP